jgi:hypothetical protein
MNLGEFDERKAVEQAKTFLAKSIFTLSNILNIDSSGITDLSTNPFDVNTPMYQGFECLKTEIIAYNKLIGK